VVNGRPSDTSERTRVRGPLRQPRDFAPMCLAALRRRLARYGDQGGPQRRIPKISQETLAEIVGTTRSRINFFMNKFRDLGFIEYNGDITINTSLLSVVLHD